MKDGLGMSCDEMAKVFGEWNKTELDSFLIEITTDILAFKDTDGKPLVEKIRDAAGQKGTGKWTAISALDKGMPVTLIGESVFVSLSMQYIQYNCIIYIGFKTLPSYTCPFHFSLLISSSLNFFPI